MIRLLIPVLIMLTAAVGIIFPGLFGRLLHRALSYCSKLLHQEETEDFQEFSPSIDMSVLNCRIQWVKLEEENNIYDALSVEICGTIQAPNDKCDTILQISILDVTDGIDQAKVVQSRLPQWSSQDGPDPSAFCYRAGLGKLPDQVTILSDWKDIAQIRFDWLLFPRKGERKLQFTTSIMSADGDQQLANAQCLFTCENPAFGYLNLQENSERTNILAVALAFAVSAADNRLCDCEIELIKNWARDNILENSASDQDEHKLDKALEKTIDFFRGGNKLDTCMMCDEIVVIAPVAQRYDIMELCLYVAQAKGSVTAEELTLLKNMAGWLEIDPERFHKMMEKVLPVAMHEVRDIETILGIDSAMSREKVREHLNKEYSKWNSRVTNSDPDIQNQADQMLSLIAEARSHYAAEAIPSK
jgi:tellurite resistance protein